MIKIIIAGGRDFNSYDMVCEGMEAILRDYDLELNEIEIVSGGARGVDALGERYAKEHNLPLTLFPADWDAYGNTAGLIRNAEMAQYADMLLAFWDGKSRGTKHMIDTMKVKRKHGKVIKYGMGGIQNGVRRICD